MLDIVRKVPVKNASSRLQGHIVSRHTRCAVPNFELVLRSGQLGQDVCQVVRSAAGGIKSLLLQVSQPVFSAQEAEIRCPR